MAPRPPVVFPGERGLVLLECTAPEYRNRGKVTGCRYHFAQNERRYVDVRDMGEMDRNAFAKVGDANTPETGERTQNPSQLDGHS
jgi:hypothetical protein